MSEVTNRRINIYIETGAAQQAFDRLNAKAEALQKQMASTSDKGQLRKLQKELDALKNPLDVAQKKLSGQMQPSLRELQTLVNNLGNRMKRMSTSDADFSKVLAQYSQAKVQLQAVQAEVRKVEQAHQGAKSNGFMQSFFGNLAANAVAQISGLLTQVIGQAFQWALEIEGVRNAYNRLNQPQLLDNLRKATNGTVSDLELMKRAVAAKNFQIPLETLGSLMEFAKRRANETGQSVDYLVDSIVTGIGRKSPLILDNLGLSASRLSSEFKKTGDFAKATFSIVNEELEKMGPALETNQDKVDRLKAGWQNFWTTVAAGAIGTFDTISDAWEWQFGDRMAMLIEKGQQQAAAKRQSAYDFEVQLIEQYKGKYAQADKAGRDKIISQVEAEIATTKMLRDQAAQKGLADQATQFGRYLDQWNGFLKDLRNQNVGTDSLAGIDAEMKLLNEQLNVATIGSKKFLDLQKEIEALQKKRDLAMGKPQAQADKKQESEASRERKRAAQELERDQERLAEALRKIRIDLSLFDASEQQKELQRAFEKYEALRKLAHGNAERLKEIDRLFQSESVQIMVKYGRKQVEEFQKLEKEKREAAEKAHQEMIASAQARAIQLQETIAKIQGQNDRSNVARLELDIMRSNGTKRLELNKQLLQEQMRQELNNKELTEAEKALIIEQYRQKELEMERTHWANVAALIIEFVGQALQVLDQFGQAKTERENADLERDRKVNDRKKSNLDRQLKGKQITQQEYDRKVAAIEQQQEKKEQQTRQKQFRREQRMAIGNAIINGAAAAQKTLATWGMPLAIPWLALTAASTIAQIATITAQKAPEYAKGGLLNGPSHQSKTRGMPVINPVTNQVQAYMEGGEAITNKRTMADRGQYTVSGTPSQIISSLNGLHGGVQWSQGATIKPSWATTPPQRMNFETIHRSFKTVKMFENGGVFPNAAPGQSNPTAVATAMDNAALLELAAVMANLQQTLSSGIPAFMSLSHFETQVARKQAIIDEATLK